MTIITIDGTDYAQLKATCSICKTTTVILADLHGFLLWDAGALIQKVLPNLTEGERELLISQTCCPCFHALFDEDEETDE